MKAFLSEYGKAMSAAIITIFIFFVSAHLLFGMTDILYPRETVKEVVFASDGGVIDLDKAAYNIPSIKVDKVIYITKGSDEYNGKAAAGNATRLNQVKAKFLEKAEAYPSSDVVGDTSKKITPVVYGVEYIDTSTIGTYPIAYEVEHNGHITIKNVTVAVL